MLVHEFAKEFGAHGTPKYGAGNVQFPDFLEIQFTHSDNYFKECCHVRLERQIGSRYFVTAANGKKTLLSYATVSFQGESIGNQI